MKTTILLKNGVCELSCSVGSAAGKLTGKFTVKTIAGTTAVSEYLQDALLLYEEFTEAYRSKAMSLLNERGARHSDIVKGPMK
jgi:hypothetical protein